MSNEQALVQDNVTALQQPADAPAPSGVAPLVAMLASGQLKAENIEAAMKLQRANDEYEAKKAYSIAMARFRKMAPVLRKDKTVDFQSAKGRTFYQHTSLGHMLNEINPLLGECDMNLSWHPRQQDGIVYVETRLTHILGHSESIELMAAPDQSGNKNSIQAVQSAITYLQRSGATALLGLASGDDDDGRGADQPPATPVEMLTESDMAEIKKACEGVGKDFDLWLTYMKTLHPFVGDVMQKPRDSKAAIIAQIAKAAKKGEAAPEASE